MSSVNRYFRIKDGVSYFNSAARNQYNRNVLRNGYAPTLKGSVAWSRDGKTGVVRFVSDKHNEYFTGEISAPVLQKKEYGSFIYGGGGSVIGDKGSIASIDIDEKVAGGAYGCNVTTNGTIFITISDGEPSEAGIAPDTGEVVNKFSDERLYAKFNNPDSKNG